MPVPDFSPGEVLTAAAMDSIGLWLVKTQTIGAGVSSVTVTDAFSATFDSYRIIVNTTGSNNAALYATLGNAGTFSAGGYNSALIYSVCGTPGTQEASTLNGIQFTWLGGGTANQAHTGQFDIHNPFQAKYTKISFGAYADNNAYGTMNGEHKVATSYADIKFTNGTGTLTGGIIRVYGYRN
jgi:hypothetical protein